MWPLVTGPAYHRLSKVLADVSKQLGIIVMCHCLHHGLCSLLRVITLEDARANKDPIYSQLHQEGDICRSGYKREKKEGIYDKETAYLQKTML